MNFEVATENLSESTIGKLKYRKICEKQNKEVKVKLETSELQIVDLDVRLVDICALPNQTLLCANSKPWNLTLYDEHFSHIRTVNQINHREIKPLSITTDEKNLIFIACIDEIIETDLEFNELFKCGSKGTEIEQFSYPSCITFANNYLYVCDRNNKRIQKLFVSNSFEIHFVENFMLSYKPDQIKVSNELACVRKFNYNSIYFYDLLSFEFKFKYDNLYGAISEIDSVFYVCDSLSTTIYCYDQNGFLLNTIRNNNFKELMNNAGLSNGKIISFNKSVIISDNTKLFRFV